MTKLGSAATIVVVKVMRMERTDPDMIHPHGSSLGEGMQIVNFLKEKHAI